MTFWLYKCLFIYFWHFSDENTLILATCKNINNIRASYVEFFFLSNWCYSKKANLVEIEIFLL